MMGMPRRLDGRRQTEVEIGEIDHDERVRLLCPSNFDEPVEHRKRLRENAKRLDEPGDTEPAIVGDELSPARHQALPAKAEDDGVRLTPPNFDCEGAGVEIAGRLPAGNHDFVQRFFSVADVRSRSPREISS